MLPIDLLDGVTISNTVFTWALIPKCGMLSKTKEKQMTKLNKISSVSEQITLNRYDNGWMVEVNGQDKEAQGWRTVKIICNTEQELLAIVKEWNTMEVNS